MLDTNTCTPTKQLAQSEPPPPTDRHAYIDTVRVWFPTWLTTADFKAIQRTCGRADWFRTPHPHNPKLQHLLRLHRPTDATFRLIAQRDHVLSRLDVALDLICEDEAHVAGLEGYLRRHLVRRYARNGKPAAYESTVYWSSRKQAPNAPVLYGEPYSRDTGELFCVHLEWRTKRAATLKRMGVASATDLIGFDYYRFWDKRLCLKSVDLSKLGRWAQGTRRRNTWIKNGIDRDLRAGGLVARNRAVLNRDGEPVLGCYAAAQHLHDAKARRALKRLDHGWLLPDAPEPEPTGDGDGLVNTTMLQLYPTTRTKLRNQQQDASTTPRDQQAGTGRSKTWWSPQQLSTYLEGCSKSLRSTYQAIFSPPKPSKPPP